MFPWNFVSSDVVSYANHYVKQEVILLRTLVMPQCFDFMLAVLSVLITIFCSSA